MIDAQEATRRVGFARDVLYRQFADKVDVTVIDAVVEEVSAPLLVAPVLDYVGILTERAARARLRASAGMPNVRAAA